MDGKSARDYERGNLHGVLTGDDDACDQGAGRTWKGI